MKGIQLWQPEGEQNFAVNVCTLFEFIDGTAGITVAKVGEALLFVKPNKCGPPLLLVLTNSSKS